MIRANDRRSWYNYFVRRYNDDPKNGAAVWLATWLLLLMHRDGEA